VRPCILVSVYLPTVSGYNIKVVHDFLAEVLDVVVGQKQVIQFHHMSDVHLQSVDGIVAQIQNFQALQPSKNLSADL
jgi:hypothetical protein